MTGILAILGSIVAAAIFCFNTREEELLLGAAVAFPSGLAALIFAEMIGVVFAIEKHARQTEENTRRGSGAIPQTNQEAPVASAAT